MPEPEGAAPRVRAVIKAIISQSVLYKKHFMKNVKECRDVNRQNVSEQGRDAIVTNHTHFGPIASSES